MSDGPRIVSLIASATEIVAGLGFADNLVGISHECDHPPEVLDRPRLSSPKIDPEQSSADIDRSVREIVRDGLSVYSVDVDALRGVAPDVIVTQDHCEVCAVSLSDVENALCSIDLPGARVCTLHPRDLSDVRRDFRLVADALGAPDAGDILVRRFDDRLGRLKGRLEGLEPRRVALVEWLAPPMVAGGWMPELAHLVAAEPVLVDSPVTFRTVDWTDLAEADPDVVVVLPCGFGVERTLAELDDPGVRAGLESIPAVGRGACWVADGNAYFNRPGPRLADSAELLAAILHPEAVPDLADAYRGAAVRPADATR